MYAEDLLVFRPRIRNEEFHSDLQTKKGLWRGSDARTGSLNKLRLEGHVL